MFRQRVGQRWLLSKRSSLGQAANPLAKANRCAAEGADSLEEAARRIIAAKRPLPLAACFLAAREKSRFLACR
jgi:hypothetical protein